MPKIVLANFRADYAENVRSASGFPVGTKTGGDTSCRFLWHASEGDVLVVPDSVGPEYVKHYSALAGVDGSRINVVPVDHLLSDSALTDEAFVSRLRPFVGTDPAQWSLFPCVFTKGVAELADALGLAPAAGSGFADQNGVDMLNLKSTFRRLAAGAGVPLPPGNVVRSSGELARAITANVAETGMAIVKQDRSGGGHGNVGLTTLQGASLPGTRYSRFIGSADVEALALDLWDELSDEFNSLLVVESYQEARKRFYLEFFISDEDVTFLNGGMIRYSPESSGTEANESASESPRWVGLDLQLHLGNRAHTEVVGHARTFLDLVRQIGYRGHVNIDGLVTVAGHIYFHEINARWGGSLVYHEVGDRLLGHGYADHSLVSSALGTDPVPFEQLVSLIDESRLAFDPDTRTGVVPLAGSSDLGGGTESVVLGRDAAEVRDLKGRLSACIAGRARTEGA